MKCQNIAGGLLVLVLTLWMLLMGYSQKFRTVIVDGLNVFLTL